MNEQARKANAKKEFQKPRGHNDMDVSGLQQPGYTEDEWN